MRENFCPIINFVLSVQYTPYVQKLPPPCPILVYHFIADFYCAKGKLIIEVDGIHHYTPKQREYDEERSKVLMDWGYAVFRIDNDWIKNNFYEVCKYIDEIVMERTGIDIRKL